jgi:hypothetical protein
MELAPIAFFSESLEFQAQLFQRIHLNQTPASDEKPNFRVSRTLTKLERSGLHNP